MSIERRAAGMTALEARLAAKDWVERRGAAIPGFAGAYLSGSILTAPDGAAWPASSDVDVVIVLSGRALPPKRGKLRHRGALLEITFLPGEELDSLPRVLSTHYLAWAFHAPRVLADPQGRLAALGRQVAAHFAGEEWVRARCESFFERIRGGFARFEADAPLAQRVMSWVFPTGITTFPVLSAALENCTVRKRYTASRRALERFGLEGFQRELLGLLCGDSPPAREELLLHLEELALTFDLAGQASGESALLPYRGDIAPDAREIAIDGSRELIGSAHPLEAVFWMAVTFARCHTILGLDSPEAEAARREAFQRFLAALGLRTPRDFIRRARQAEAFLPRLEAVVEQMLMMQKASGAVGSALEGESLPERPGGVPTWAEKKF